MPLSHLFHLSSCCSVVVFAAIRKPVLHGRAAVYPIGGRRVGFVRPNVGHPGIRTEGLWIVRVSLQLLGHSTELTFLLLVPSGLSLTHQTGWFMVQRSDFSLAKIQGASGLALDPCVLFSVWVLVGCLVSGLAVAGVAGCDCRRVLLIFWRGW